MSKQKLCQANNDRVHYIVLSKDGVEYSGNCPKRYHDHGTAHVKTIKK